LLGCPSVGRGTCDADVDYSPRVQFDNEVGETTGRKGKSLGRKSQAQIC